MEWCTIFLAYADNVSILGGSVYTVKVKAQTG